MDARDEIFFMLIHATRSRADWSRSIQPQQTLTALYPLEAIPNYSFADTDAYAAQNVVRRLVSRRLSSDKIRGKVVHFVLIKIKTHITKQF